MPAELDTTEDQTSFAAAREGGWHRLGQVLPDLMTAKEAMAAAHLADWNVRKVPLTAADPETGDTIPVTTHRGVVRDNPIDGALDSLGIVSPRYEIIQNEEHATFLDALVDESGARFDTAGALDGGRRVFLSMEMPESLLVGGVDKVARYIAAINSHDSSMAFTLLVTNVRIVCQNTLNAALADNKGIFRIRHTSGAKQAVQAARETLKLTHAYDKEFEAEAERMVQATLTEGEFMDIVAANFGAPEDAPAATVTRNQAKLDQIQKLFVEENTQESIRDTAWAGFNALAEYADHYSLSRGDEGSGANQAKRAVLDQSFKTKAWELMLAQS